MASAAGGLAEALGYGPLHEGVRQFPEIAPGVAAVILGWTGLTLAIIAAWVLLLWRPQILSRIAGALPASRRSSQQRRQPGG